MKTWKLCPHVNTRWPLAGSSAPRTPAETITRAAAMPPTEHSSWFPPYTDFNSLRA